MQPLCLLDDPAQASTLLDETRLRLLHELATPDSAAGVARRLDLPRQRVNYHIRELEKAGLLTLVEERRKGNCNERVLQATARAFLVSPDALVDVQPDPDRVPGRFTPLHLIAAAARLIRDVGALAARTPAPPTLTIRADVRFATTEDRDAFAEDLATEVARLVREYTDEDAPDAHAVRLLVGAYPAEPAP